MQTMQDKVTGQFRAAAEDEAGLEFTVAERTGTKGRSGDWYAMDGLDTRLRVSYEFGDYGVKFRLAGQALAGQAPEFFRERELFPARVPGGERVVELRAEYHDGDRLRKALAAVRDLLEPYAKVTDAAVLGQLAAGGLSPTAAATVIHKARTAGRTVVQLRDGLFAVTYDAAARRYTISLAPAEPAMRGVQIGDHGVQSNTFG